MYMHTRQNRVLGLKSVYACTFSLDPLSIYVLLHNFRRFLQTEHVPTPMFSETREITVNDIHPSMHRLAIYV